jgi:hypothetical protein
MVFGIMTHHFRGLSLKIRLGLTRMTLTFTDMLEIHQLILLMQMGKFQPVNGLIVAVAARLESIIIMLEKVGIFIGNVKVGKVVLVGKTIQFLMEQTVAECQEKLKNVQKNMDLIQIL